MKMDKKSGEGMCCKYCGAGMGKCHCGKVMVLVGVVIGALGVGLWMGRLNLEQTAAIVLVLVGLKKLIFGLKWW